MPGARRWETAFICGAVTDSQPWQTDRELTADLASALIRLRFPEVDAHELRHLGSGWEFDAFLTQDGWVFRFPRRLESARLFEPEKIAHDLVAPVLPEGILIPRVTLLGEPALGFPYPFAGHRYIAGVSADQLATEHFPVFWAGVAAGLGALHSIPVEVARGAGVRRIDLEETGRNEWLELGFEAAFQLRGMDPSLDEALTWLARVPFPVPVPEAPATVIHQDLSPEHLLADPATGQLVGILDWTDVTIGDAARDFVFLVTWNGWRSARAVLRAYTPAADEAFFSRLRFMSRLLSLMWLATAYRADSDLARHLQGVRNAFGDEV